MKCNILCVFDFISVHTFNMIYIEYYTLRIYTHNYFEYISFCFFYYHVRYILLIKFYYMYIFFYHRNEARKMHPVKYITILFAFVVFSSISVYGFPDGAPVDACVKPRPNQPYHGEARSQSLNTSPYKILASSSQYIPGSQITGKSINMSELILSEWTHFDNKKKKLGTP